MWNIAGRGQVPWTQHIVNRAKPPSISGRENRRENQSLGKRGHRLSIVVRGGQEHFLVTGYVGHSRSSSDSGRKYRKENWQSRGPRVRVPSPPQESPGQRLCPTDGIVSHRFSGPKQGPTRESRGPASYPAGGGSAPPSLGPSSLSMTATWALTDSATGWR